MGLDQKRNLSPFSHTFTTNRRDLFITTLVVAVDQYNSATGGRIHLILRRGDVGCRLVGRCVGTRHTPSILRSQSLFFARFFARCRRSLALRSLSLSLLNVDRSLHNVGWPLLLRSFVVRSWLAVLVLGSLSFVLARCPLSWLAVLCSWLIVLVLHMLSSGLEYDTLVSAWPLVLRSFLCFIALFGGGLRFFAQWRRSSLNVVGRWTELNR